MSKTGDDFQREGYATVAERIRLFYDRHPGGRIVTELISRTDRDVVFKALVYRATTDAHPSATGWAVEREGDGDINVVACLENTETSAVGRIDRAFSPAGAGAAAVPVVEQGIAAGVGRDLWEMETSTWVKLPPGLPKAKYLALGVVGESMAPVMHTGDTILVRVEKEIRRNTAIVARHPEDASRRSRSSGSCRSRPPAGR